MNRITSEANEWRKSLDFSLKIYKYKFDGRILIYAQKPDATAVANMKIWNRIGRYVNKGTRSIAVIDKSKARLKLEYLFDVSNTNGPPWTIPKTWQLNEEILLKLVDRLNNEWDMKELNLENSADKQGKSRRRI